MTDETTRLSHLRTRLAETAMSTDLLDVAWRTYDSPIGALTLAATPVGLVRVALANEPVDDVLQELADTLSPRVLQASGSLDTTVRQLDAYFAGRLQVFDLPLDWSLTRGFRSQVQQALPGVRYGATVTYRELAERAGNARAFRAAASACATNPLPVVVPCHRVVRSDGSIGEYRGGADAKRVLLTLESEHGGRQTRFC